MTYNKDVKEMKFHKMDAKRASSLIQALKDPMKVNFRDAIQAIPDIVRLLGEERTIHEFIPFIFDFSKYNTNEIIQFLQGFENISLELSSHESIFQFLIEFSRIFLLNNRKVDEIAMNSILKLIFMLKPQIINEVLIDYVKWMVESPVVYIRRAAPQFVSILTEEISKTILLSIAPILLPLCEDKSIIVRTSMAKYIGIILYEFDGSIVPDIRSVIQKLMESKSNSVHMHIPQILCGYVKQETNESVIEFCNELLSSSDWKVRHQLFEKLDSILFSCMNSKDVLSIITKGLIDPDDDVAFEAAKQFEFYINHFPISQSDIERIFGSVLRREEPKIIIALANSLPTLFNVSEYNQFAVDTLVNLVKKNDEEITRGICDIFNGTPLPDNVVELIMENVISIKDWRIRNEVSHILPHIISNITPNIMSYISILLEDETIAVRNSLCTAMNKFSQKFGENWIKTDLIPTLEEMFKHEDYQIRQTALACIANAGIFGDPDAVKIIESAVKDPVSNVRLVAAKLIPTNSPLCQVLLNDEDIDVREKMKARLP